MKKLSGSEKQIAWAEDIRTLMVDVVNAEHDYQIARANERFAENPEKLAARIDRLEAIHDDRLENIGQIESAKWFIDNRGAVSLAKEIGIDELDPMFLCTEATRVSRVVEHGVTMQRIRA